MNAEHPASGFRLELNQQSLLKESLSHPSRYLIKREIGKGGMGAVYEAFDFELRRKVAIKLILRERLASMAPFEIDLEIRRLRDEARFAAKLQHTNIVNVHRFFVLGENWKDLLAIEEDVLLMGAPVACIVLQYIDGCQLSELLSVGSQDDAKDEPLSRQRKTAIKFIGDPSKFAHAPTRAMADEETDGAGDGASSGLAMALKDPDYIKRVARVGQQLANAITHSHDKKIFHNDIKPQNVMVDDQGNAWLTDFGVATNFDSMSLKGGTAEYMAPEALKGTGNARTDIFSLGATLFRMLTGTRVYSKPPQGLAKNASDSPLPNRNPRALNPSIPKDLEAIIQTCLASSPEHRYQNAADLEKDLLAFLDGRSVSVKPVGSLGQLSLWSKRNPIAAALLGLVVVSTMLGLCVSSWQWSVAKAETQRANKNAQNESVATLDATNSAKRSADVVKIVKEAFVAADPRFGGNSDMSAKDVLILAAQKANESNLDDLGRIEILSTLAEAAIAVGAYDVAVESAREAMTATVRANGENHPETYKLQSTLALALYVQQDFESAREVFEDVYQKQLVEIGPSNVETIVSACSLAMTYKSIGEVDRALEIYSNNVDKLRQLRGDNHEQTLNSLHNYSSALSEKGELEKARLMCEETLDLKREVFGADHPSTLLTLRQLGMIHSKSGNLEKGIELIEECLTLTRKKLGVGHPQATMALRWLSEKYWDVRDYDKAIPLLKELVEAQTKGLGEKHTDTRSTRGRLATVWISVGKAEQAADVFEDLLRLDRQETTPNQPRILSLSNTLANCYRAMGEYEKAVALSKEMVEEHISFYGPTHHKTLNAMNTLAYSLFISKQYVEGIKVNQDALKKSEEEFGRQYPLTQTLVKNRGMMMKDSGKPEKAIPLLTEAMLNTKFPRSRSRISTDLRDAYILANDIEGYLELAEKELELIRKTEDEFEVVKILFSLSREHFRIEMFQKSLELADERLEILESMDVLPGASLATLSLKGEILHAMNRTAEAEEILLSVYKRLKPSKDMIPKNQREELLLVTQRLEELFKAKGNEEEAKNWQQEKEELEK